MAMTASAAELHVAPEAKPGGDGSKAKPFATLVQARYAIRAMKKAGTMPADGVTVLLHDGTFALSETFVLGPEDSGTAAAPIIYASAPDAKPVISGGVRITGWELFDQAKNIYRAKVAADLDTRQLYVNGERVPRASSGLRELREGWAITEAGVVCPPEVASWRHPERMEFPYKSTWMHKIGGFSGLKDGKLQIKEPYRKNALIFGGLPPAILVLDNVFEYLNAEGEWYLDPTEDMVYYKPRKGEDLATATIIAPRLETLITGTHLRHVTFRGLTFAHATWLRPNDQDGYDSIQNGAHLVGSNVNFESAQQFMPQVPGNVRIAYAEAVRFEGNTFEHLGAAGLEIGRGSRKNVIFNNVFRDISANGLVIGDNRDHHPFVRDLIKDNHVDNNLVTQVAREYRDCTGISVFFTEHTVLTHNHIHDVPYSGLNMGWGWGRYDPEERGRGYGVSTSQRNCLVSHNLIHDVMRELEDGGAIYSLAAHPGLRIVHNVTDLNIYLDDGSRYVEVGHNHTRSLSPIKLGPHIIHDNVLIKSLADVPAEIRAGVGRNGVLTPFPEAPSRLAGHPPRSWPVAMVVTNEPVARWSFERNAGSDAPVELAGKAAIVPSAGPTGGLALRLNKETQDHAVGKLATTRTDDVTMMAWVKWNQVGPCTIFYNGTGDRDGFGLVTDADNRLVVCVGGVAFVKSATYLGGCGEGEWTHLALVRRAGLWECYVNGFGLRLGAGAESAPVTPTGKTWIGASNATSHFFNGHIADARVYEQALLPGQIWTIAQAVDPAQADADLTPTAKVPVPNDHLGYWNFDGKGADAHPLTAEGGATIAARGGLGDSGCGVLTGGGRLIAKVVPATEDVTISTWIWWEGAGAEKGPNPGLLSFGMDNSGFDLVIVGRRRLNLVIQGVAALEAEWVPPARIWSHVVAVRREGAWEIHVNGRQVYLHGNLRAAWRERPKGGTILGGGFHGRMDETRLYGRALSRAEIVALYRSETKEQ
jgi:hypothetical protein